MIDIAKKEELVRFLLDRKLIEDAAGTKIKYFGGGVSGTVAMAETKDSCFIIKQALASLKVKADWRCDESRMKIEYDAQDLYSRIIPDYVPKPICFDGENYIMVRHAAPDRCVMWKTELLEGLLDFRIARKAAEALRNIHNRTAGDPGVMEAFSDAQFFYGLRISPYIEYVVEKYPELGGKAGKVIDMLMTGKMALIHGDYSPKNIMTDGTDMYLLDLEVSYYGHPSFDMAFFANHFLLKSVKNRQWADAYLNMLRFMKDIYFGGISFTDARLLEKQVCDVLGFLFLARVDGKSPVEYLTEEADKELVRRTAFTMIERQPETLEEMTALVRAALSPA